MLALEKVCVRKLYWNMHHERTIGLVGIELERKTYLVSVFLRRNWKLFAMFHHKLIWTYDFNLSKWQKKKFQWQHNIIFHLNLSSSSSKIIGIVKFLLKAFCAKWWFEFYVGWYKNGFKNLELSLSNQFFMHLKLFLISFKLSW